MYCCVHYMYTTAPKRGCCCSMLGPVPSPPSCRLSAVLWTIASQLLKCGNAIHFTLTGP